MVLLWLPAYLVLIVMDVLILFLLVRLLTYVTSIKPITVMNRIGSEAVDLVTHALGKLLRRWHTGPLSRPQMEALSLLILCLSRMAIGAMLHGIW